jgi:hypothetical protein
LGLARMFLIQAVDPPRRRIETTYALSPRRIARTHLRRALPVLRPVVVITPHPRGGNRVNQGSISALRTRAPVEELTNGLCRRSGTYTSAHPTGAHGHSSAGTPSLTGRQQPLCANQERKHPALGSGQEPELL